jgi:hypothetical protein
LLHLPNFAEETATFLILISVRQRPPVNSGAQMKSFVKQTFRGGRFGRLHFQTVLLDAECKVKS